jgi:hypothetical protein
MLLGEVRASAGCLTRTTTSLGEARSSRCFTRLLLHRLLHLHDLVGTKPGGSAIITAYSASLLLRSGGSAIITAYSASLRLRSGAWIQGCKIKFTIFQPLGDKQSLTIVLGGYSAAPLRTSTRSYNRLPSVGL